MPCNCSTNPPYPTAVVPVTPGLPTLASLNLVCTAGCNGDSPFATSPALVTGNTCEKPIRSAVSAGTTLGPEWTDAVVPPKGEGIKLLGRWGKKLAEFTGDGFLRIIDGYAYLVSTVPLNIRDVWHQWFQPAGINKTPVLGDPMPFPLVVIADEEGGLHGVKGFEGPTVTHDSIHVYSFERKRWETRSVADFPVLVRGLVPQASQIELTGFTPIPVNGGTPNDVRELKRLMGEGIVYLEQQPTIASSCECDGCQPVSAVSAVAKVFPYPVEDGTFTLQVNVNAGVRTFEWLEN